MNIDAEAWKKAHPDDLWVFDKFILARKLGYACGVKGMEVPGVGIYVVRPCVNFMGMGAGAKLMVLKSDTEEEVPDGYFWCERFIGRHLSVDYYNKQQMLCVEGFKDDHADLQRWTKWKKTKDIVPFPEILYELKGDYEWINVEYIDGKIIEVHLRCNPDFQKHHSDVIIPVWKDQFILDKDGDRVGFLLQQGENNDEDKVSEE